MDVSDLGGERGGGEVGLSEGGREGEGWEVGGKLDGKKREVVEGGTEVSEAKRKSGRRERKREGRGERTIARLARPRALGGSW